MSKTAQEKGRDFESRFAAKYDGKEQPGSGNGIYHKLDVKDSKFLWSLKWTSKKSFSFKSEDFKEVKDEVYGPGGLGAEYVPGMAVELEGEEYAILRMQDLVGLMKQDVKVFEPSEKEIKRSKASVPKLLRPIDSE